MIVTPLMWVGFLAFIFLMLAVDLGLFHKESHRVGAKEAAAWTGVWMTLALTFGGILWHFEGHQYGTEFIAGYLIEQSLSMDNMFVFILIFSAMKIPPALQHRVLFWGILSALILRAIMIFAGAALLNQFHWLIGIFGIFLLYTGGKLLFKSEEAEEAPTPSAGFGSCSASFHRPRSCAATGFSGRRRARASGWQRHFSSRSFLWSSPTWSLRSTRFRRSLA